MTYPAFMREKAREMRETRGFTIDEIAESARLQGWIDHLEKLWLDSTSPGA